MEVVSLVLLIISSYNKVEKRLLLRRYHQNSSLYRVAAGMKGLTLSGLEFHYGNVVGMHITFENYFGPKHALKQYLNKFWPG